MSTRKRNKKSQILEQFDRTNSLVKCKLCEKTYSTKTSHSMLKAHYTKHENGTNLDQSTSRNSISGTYYDQLILNFIIHGNHPFSIVDEEHFKNLIKELKPAYKMLSRTQLSVNIQNFFKEKQEHLIEFLKTVPTKIALTLDFWTSVTNKPYMVITAHFMLETKLSAIILEFVLLPYPHSSGEILYKLVEILEYYSIDKRVTSITTDNERTNLKLMQLLILLHSKYENIIHTRCLAHVLNLVVKKGLKTIEKPIDKVSKLVKVINTAPKKKQMYFETCTSLNVPQLSLIQEISIRWNTVYLMLERAYSMKNVLDHICKEKKEFYEYLIQNWDEVNEIILFLKPFYDATLLLSKSKYPSLYYVVPIVDVLKEQILLRANNEIFENCATAMIEKLEEYKPHVYTDFAKFAVILDPRLKNTYFSEQGGECDNILLRFKTYFTTHYANSSRDQTLATTSQSQNAVQNIFSAVYKQKNAVQDEIQNYLSMPIETEDTDVLLWWSNQKYHLPNLTQMAKDILSIPATSVPSEQAFSKSGNLITKKRCRLSDKSIRASMCLSSWMTFL